MPTLAEMMAANEAKKSEAATAVPTVADMLARNAQGADRFGVARTEAEKIGSDQAARVLRMEAKTGLPSQMIRDRLDVVEAEAARQDFDADRFKRESPIVAAWMAEKPEHAALVGEDLSGMSYLERQVKHIGRSFERGNATTELSAIGESALLGRATPEQRARQKALQTQMQAAGDFGITGFFEGIPGAVANQLPILAESMWGKVKAAAVGGGAGFAAGAATGATVAAIGGQLGPQVAVPEEAITVPAAALATGVRVGAKGAALGWRYGAAVEAARMEAGLAYLDFEELRDDNGAPMDPDLARGAALMVGVVNGSLEAFGFEQLAKTIPGLNQLGRGGVKKLLAQPTARAALAGFAKTVSTAMATEGGTEFLQELVTSGAGELSLMISDGSINTLSTGEILGRVFNDNALVEAAGAGRAGAQGGGGISAVGASASVAIELRAAKRAQATAAAFAQVGETVAKTKAFAALPAKVQEVVGRVAGSAAVFMPMDSWNAYWQKQGADPRAAAIEVMGDAKAYDEAAEGGRDLEVPTPVYAIKIAPTPHNEFFARELRTDPQEMNAREADAYVEGLDQQTQESNDAVEADPSESVRADVVQQLVATKRVEQSTAESLATFVQGFFRTQGERTGQDPVALYQRFGLRIVDSFKQQTIQGPNGEPVAEAAQTYNQAERVPAAGNILNRMQSLVAGRERERAKARPSDPNDETAIIRAVPGEDVEVDEGVSAIAAGMARVAQTVQTLMQGAENVIRGGFRRMTGRAEIALFEQANLSTFLHESGHLFLEVLAELASDPDAPQQIKDDFAAALKWTGFETVENMRAMQAEAADISAVLAAQQREPTPAEAKRLEELAEPHERFARGMEAYLLEGRAPSAALREVFARFKTWLVHVYKVVRRFGRVDRDTAGQALNARLTDEVRAVMDRLLASDEAIAEAEAEGNVAPIFATPEEAGKTPAQFAAYSKATAAASVRARENLEAKLFEQYRAERSQAYADDREKVSAEVAAEVNATPVAIAWARLKNGKNPDGSPLPDGIQHVKLSKQAIVDSFGKPALIALRGLYQATGGMHPEVAAEMFGFASGQGLLDALRATKAPGAVIEERTNAEMAQRHPDMRFDGSMADAARAAVQNEERGQVVHEELKALRALERAARPVVKQAVGEAVANEQAVAQARAEAASDARSVRDDAARLADALSRSVANQRVPPLDRVRAQAQQAIARLPVNRVRPSAYWKAAQSASRRAHEAAQKRNYQTAAEQKSRELHNLELYRAAVSTLDEIKDFVTDAKKYGRKSVRERIGKAGHGYLEQIEALLARFQIRRVPIGTPPADLSEWLAERLADGDSGGEEVALPPAAMGAGVDYRTMTVEEVLGLRDGVRQLEHLARERNKSKAAKLKWDRDEMKSDLIGAVQANMGDRGPPPLTKHGLSFFGKARKAINVIDASLLKPEQLIAWLDGGRIDGPWSRALFNGASDAQAAELDYDRRITAKIAELVRQMPKAIRDRMLDRVEIPGVDRAIVRRDLIGVALNAGNESNMDKMLRGMAWSPEQVQAMVDQLTSEEIEFVNGVHAALEGMWPEIAALSKELTGLEPERIEPKAYPSRNGTITGGYYPMMYDAALSEQGELQLASNIGGLVQPGFVRATTPSGNRKNRKQGFAAPMDFDLDRLPGHIAGVIKDLTHRRWLMDANWIVNDRDVRAAIGRHMGEEYVTLLADWVRTVVNDRNPGSLKGVRWWTKLMEGARFNTMIAGLGFKAATMLSQIGGIGPAIDIVGVKWFRRGSAHALKHPLATRDFIIERSGEMRHRFATRDDSVREVLRKLGGRTDRVAQIQRVSMAGIGYGDRMISMPTWMGAYLRALDEGHTDDDAIRSGDRAVRLSQGAGGAKDLAAVSASRDWLRLITMFYTPFSALYARLRDVGHEVGGIKDVPRACIRSFWIWVVASTVSELAAGRGPDEDEEWLEWFRDVVGFYPLLAVPGARDVAAGVVGDYGYSFSPIVQAGASVAGAANAAVDVYQGDKELEDLAASTFKASGYLVGLPTGQAKITGGYILDLYRGDADPESPQEFVHDMIYRRDK